VKQSLVNVNAQGLVHAGKGLVTLSPYHPDRSLPNTPALAALIAMSHVSLDFKGLILGKHHFLLYLLVAAMRPRMLITVRRDRYRYRNTHTHTYTHTHTHIYIYVYIYVYIYIYIYIYIYKLN